MELNYKTVIFGVAVLVVIVFIFIIRVLKRAEKQDQMTKHIDHANATSNKVTAIMNEFQRIAEPYGFQLQMLTWQRKENLKNFIFEQIKGLDEQET